MLAKNIIPRWGCVSTEMAGRKERLRAQRDRRKQLPARLLAGYSRVDAQTDGAPRGYLSSPILNSSPSA